MKTFATFIALFALSISESNAQTVTDETLYSSELSDFNGYGTITYDDRYYKGGIRNGFAHGNGVLYYNDGSFLKCTFKDGRANGHGILVLKGYGYFSGTIDGNMVFPDTQEEAVSPTVIMSSVRQATRENITNEAYDPDGYRITKIDINTEFGQKLLGKYIR